MNVNVMKNEGRQEALKQWGIVKKEYTKEQQPLAMVKKHISYRSEGYNAQWLKGFEEKMKELVNAN